jgi:hypothetical protein
VADVILARWELGGNVDAVDKFWLPCHCENIQPAECDDDGDCEDDMFCTGVETCNLGLGVCESSGDPCGAGETCDEANDTCVADAECANDADCDDGLFCTGVETCDIGTETCVEGMDPCDVGETCDEIGDVCIPAAAEGACCDGETCTVTTEAACIDGGGAYEGDDTGCDPNPCVEEESNCCVPHDSEGCDDEACEALVCGQDPFCCNPVANWDILCVNQAVELCGDLCDPPLGPVNDACEDSIEIFDGETEFNTTSASTDGVAHSDELCQFDGQTYNDIWYDYFATCTGDLTVTTCEELGGSAEYDSDIVVYDGCDICLPGDELVLDCNDDDPVNACGIDDFHSTVVVPVVTDNCYKIRIGGFKGGDSGTGTVLITCEP